MLFSDLGLTVSLCQGKSCWSTNSLSTSGRKRKNIKLSSPKERQGLVQSDYTTFCWGLNIKELFSLRHHSSAQRLPGPTWDCDNKMTHSAHESPARNLQMQMLTSKLPSYMYPKKLLFLKMCSLIHRSFSFSISPYTPQAYPRDGSPPLTHLFSSKSYHKVENLIIMLDSSKLCME